MGIRGREVLLEVTCDALKEESKESFKGEFSYITKQSCWLGYVVCVRKGWHVSVDLIARVMLSIVGCGQEEQQCF